MKRIYISKSTFLRNSKKASRHSVDMYDKSVSFVYNGYFYGSYYSNSEHDYVYFRRKFASFEMDFISACDD